MSFATPEGQSQGLMTDLAIHTLGWKSFQDLCAQVCAEVFGTTVSVYREAQDGGQDAVFLTRRLSEHEEQVEATVQCKFSSKADLRLRASDINSELDTIRELVLLGRARIYYLISSLGVDAPVAAEIRDKLLEAGVVEPHVLGREWLTIQIRSSPRLRALVPRVYGLGDLSTILDERCAQQTQALLGHLRPGLRVYVPTAAHRSAVRILTDHKIVLLLGAPATGKSMLAAILATTAIDGDGHACLKCDGPLELAAHWNPNERNRLYWVDDAFGPNQVRPDFVDSWISALPRLKTAIEHGNRFILTSRSHIWYGAKPKLGTRNLPVLMDGRAVVDLGTLGLEEREQIIYNHIKAGNQTSSWKRLIKPYLPRLAESPLLLPEIARRLGDSSFTKALKVQDADLIKFVEEPEELLVQTIRELDDAHQAAMTLVFLWQGKLPTHELTGNSTKLIAEKYDVTPRAIAEALPQLEHSFLSKRQEATHLIWGFVHPTFTDAISRILSGRPDLVELYVQGAKLETLLTEAVCEGARPIRDAVVIPVSASERLVQRLLNTPDVADLNRSLFEFLSIRASDCVIGAVLNSAPNVAYREARRHWRVWGDQRIRFLARANKLCGLPDEVRFLAEQELERIAVDDLDVSFLDEDDILGLIRPTRLVSLGAQLTGMLTDVIPSRIVEIAEEANPDQDVPDQFDQVRSFVDQLRELFVEDNSIQSTLKQLGEEIDEAVSEVSSRKTPDDDDESWFSVSPAKVDAVPRGRSTFSDVDD
ncbi:hypothetical protein [uncultured Pseudomonas sp.]|uniref:nSTAND3 domain-containing NTPase n=1 Tax=uncultured Pseudomonas sp. TaxID=114707 RepID=UPI00262A3C92|nr:hypothetical protein [uncultured Pseudomonas sp.]